MKPKVKFGVRIARVTLIPPPPEAAVKGPDGKWGYPQFSSAEKTSVLAHIYLTLYDRLDWNVVKEVALESERLGYDSIIFPDHPIFGRGTLDTFSTLAALVGVTSKINLGTMTFNTMRYLPSPSLFAKEVATLDYISNGRLFPLGLGTGYMKEEYESYGFPFPPFRVRMEQLRETIQIIRLMFTREKATFHGKHFHIENAVCEPKPVQNPFPIAIGGTGPKMLKLEAELADFINISGSVSEVKQKLQVLEKHCQEIGRNFDEIEKSWHSWFWIYPEERELARRSPAMARINPESILMCTPDQCIERLQQLLDLGITYFTLRFEDLPSLDGLRLFANEVMPHFR